MPPKQNPNEAITNAEPEPDAAESLFSCYQGTNADLLKAAADMYLKDGQFVCDPTWGKGVFWRNIDTSRIELSASDLVTCPDAPYDCRDLPYENSYFDLVVLDPPYAHNPGAMIVDPNYQNAATTKGMYHRDILMLYALGMAEAKRVLKPEGMLWVKTQDELESSIQRWSHEEIHALATELGFFAKDLMMLMQIDRRPTVQHKEQKHVRKAHSYLWIFKLPSKSEKTSLAHYVNWPGQPDYLTAAVVAAKAKLKGAPAVQPESIPALGV